MTLVEAAKEALDLLEHYEYIIEWDRGSCYTLQQMEDNGILPKEILNLRKAIKDHEEST